MVPVALYARYSTDRQDSRSIEDQLRRCRAWAKGHDFQVAAEYQDAAQSGASLNRAGMQHLLAAARSKPRPFEAILVDDLSRLSRDFIDTLNLRRELLALGVALVDCASGVDSRDKKGKLITYVQGIINESYLDDLRDKTHRGLEGRALGGFHTGGRCFGYRTVPEPSPEDPEHPRAVQQVDDDEAAIVLRVFKDYVNGAPLARIASNLNKKGIPAPYDDASYPKPAGRGWSASIVGARGEWANYGCSAHHTKGSTICSNKKTISERRVTESVMQGLVDYVQSPSFKAWVEESTAAAARALARTTGGEELRLTAAVLAQAARVEKTLTALIELGVTEAGRARLASEEKKLRDLRRQLAEVSVPPEKRVVLDLRQAARAFEDIGALVAVDPQAARARLFRYLNPVVLAPVPDQETGELVYNFDISLKNDSASLAGGRSVPSVVDGHGCGGLQPRRP